MGFYTGRLDMIEEDEDMLDLIHDFVSHFEIDGCCFTFEDKTKTGLPTKPHYHFIIKTDYKHDTLRKYLSKIGFPGSFSSIKPAEINTNPPDMDIPFMEVPYKAYHYVLKQGDVVYTDWSENKLAKRLKAAAEYQETIKPKLNTFKDHMEELLKQLISKNQKWMPTEDYRRGINERYNVDTRSFESIDYGEYEHYPIDEEILSYIQDHLDEFMLPCRNTVLHWLIVFTKTLAPTYVHRMLQSHYNHLCPPM